MNIMDKIVSIQRTESFTKLISPSEARSWRETKHFERQRNISKANVSRLAKEISNGNFIPGLQVYICVLPDGRELVINGNHTLEAVVASGVSIELSVTKHWVRDLDEAGKIYAVFDIQKIRTWADTIRATGTESSVPNARLVASCIKFIREGFWQNGHAEQLFESRLEIAQLVPQYEAAAKLYEAAAAATSRDIRKFSRRVPIMAVALETLQAQPSHASEFWQRLFRDDGLTSGMPEHALLRWLRNLGSECSGPMRGEQAKAAAIAWNAAFKGEKKTVIKPNAVLDFVILGTRFHQGINRGVINP